MKPQFLKLYISLELIMDLRTHPEPFELLEIIKDHVLEYIDEKGPNETYNNDEVIIEEQTIIVNGEIRPFSILLKSYDKQDKDIHLIINETKNEHPIIEFAEYEITPNVTALH